MKAVADRDSVVVHLVLSKDELNILRGEHATYEEVETIDVDNIVVSMSLVQRVIRASDDNYRGA